MNSRWERLAALASWHQRLTPGQRWTLALTLAFTLAVLRWGGPVQVIEAGTPNAAPAPEQTAPAVSAEKPTKPTASPSPTSSPDPVALPPPVRNDSAPGQQPSTSTEEPGASDPPAAPSPEPDPTPPGPITAVALVRPAQQGELDGRGDRDMAATYLDRASFNARTVEIGEDPEATCASIGGATVVVTRAGLAPQLRDCVLAADSVIVASDARGSQLHTDGGVFSSRRSLSAGLVDLAGVDDGQQLQGAVGIAVEASLADEVEQVRPVLTAAGVDVVAVATVADEADVSNGVLDFTAAGVETTVFALPVEFQRQWVSMGGLVGQGQRYVVADMPGVIADETYPASFDGARAYTSHTFPWQSRTDDAPAITEECQAVWEEAAGTPPPGDAELSRALTWCGNIALADTAITDARALDQPVRAVIATLEFTSPVAGMLGAFADGGFGPRVDHLLTWQAGCLCWADPEIATRRKGP